MGAVIEPFVMVSWVALNVGAEIGRPLAEAWESLTVPKSLGGAKVHEDFPMQGASVIHSADGTTSGTFLDLQGD